MSAAARDPSFLQSEVGLRRALESDVAPRAVLDPTALSFHLLRPSSIGPADVPLFGEAYNCWSEVWQETFAELDNQRDVPSDDFTRQDEIGALFHGYECIALSCYRWVDLSSPIARADSYFKVWPEEVRDAACARGSRICVSSHFAIRAPWRRIEGCCLKDVLGALVVERFLASSADALVAAMRVDRGMGKLAARLGSRRLRGGVIHHGVEVDLIAFYRDTCVRPPARAIDEEIVQALRPREVSR